MEVYWLIVFFLFGITFGSFFNVVGLRLPENISFVHGNSQCPECRHRLGWHELIPVLSFCWQKGKCRHCHTPISVLYPVMELFTGILFAYAYMQLGFTFELIIAVLFISMIVTITVSDIVYMLIPNKILLFYLPLFILSRLIFPLDPWYDAVIGATLGFTLIALIIFISKGGMGAGDMKLFFVMGLVLGWKGVLLTLFLAALLGSVIGILLKQWQKGGAKQPIPFGPYIAIAGIITYFHGESMIDLYMSLF